MKNAHGVEPTKYMKRKESEHAIQCRTNYGPIFGDDIYIDNNCSKEDSCWIENGGTSEYECHSEYTSSLFVNTAGPDDTNSFSVLDYEVYTHYWSLLREWVVFIFVLLIKVDWYSIGLNILNRVIML